MRFACLRLLLAVLSLLWLGAVVLGCEDADEGTTPIADAVLPDLVLTDQTPDLVITWIDERGETHTGIALSEVPEASKQHVRIVTRTAGHGRMFYVADLTKKKPDGSYEVSTTPSSEWEKLIAGRRDAYREKHAPPPTPRASTSVAPDPAPSGGIEATVYGAVWCGPCHQAERYLKKQGVKVHYYDIEKEPSRGREMQRKLRAAGKSGGTIPVIDINGVILQGFSPRAVNAALKKAGRSMTL